MGFPDTEHVIRLLAWNAGGAGVYTAWECSCLQISSLIASTNGLALDDAVTHVPPGQAWIAYRHAELDD